MCEVADSYSLGNINGYSLNNILERLQDAKREILTKHPETSSEELNFMAWEEGMDVIGSINFFRYETEGEKKARLEYEKACFNQFTKQFRSICKERPAEMKKILMEELENLISGKTD